VGSAGQIGVRAATADRFIFVERNLNNTSIIDGGRVNATINAQGVLAVDLAAANIGNNDILEVRNNAQVTLTDLSGISNVGNIEFTNDTNSVQTSELALDNATVNRMVNTGSDALAANITRTETLNIRAVDGVGGAFTVLRMDTNGLTDNELRLNVSAGAGNDFLAGGGGSDTIVAGVGLDTITGGVGADTMTGGDGADTFVYGTSGTATNVALARLIGSDTIQAVGGGLDFVVGTDKISLSKAGFVALQSAAGNGFTVGAEFASVANDAAVDASAAFIVFSQATGTVFFNGSNAAGDSAALVTLTGVNNLAAGDFVLVA